MAFLQKFLSTLNPWRNPTWDWPEDVGLPLVLDLDAQQFCGVGIDDPVERLSFLGRGQTSGAALRWPEKGVAAECHSGRIFELHFYFGHAAEPAAGCFAGACRYRGEEVGLAANFTETEAQRLFGPPNCREEDEQEVILYYEFANPSGNDELGDLEWQLEFGLDGRLKCLVLCV